MGRKPKPGVSSAPFLPRSRSQTSVFSISRVGAKAAGFDAYKTPLPLLTEASRDSSGPVSSSGSGKNPPSPSLRHRFLQVETTAPSTVNTPSFSGNNNNSTSSKSNDSSYRNCFSASRTLQTAKSLKTCIKLARKSAQFQMYSSDHVGGRGALIVLEGLDRCGKTTQCGSLVSFLERRGISVEAWRFPDRNTDIGRMISSYLTNKSQLDDQAIHLLFSANRWEKRPLMENKLRNGTTLVVDRYSYSGVSFSAAKGLDIEWCKTPEKGLIAPDLVVYLDIMPEEAARRGGYGTERYEQLEFQRIVAHHYQNLKDASWKVIDARLPLQSIENMIHELALDSIKSCQKKPLSSLWLTD